MEPNRKISFTIEGQPLPQERPYLKRRGTFDRQRSKQEKARIKTIALPYRFKPLSEKEIGIMVEFYGARGNADSDNLFKLLTDGLDGIFWKNDSQIKLIHIMNIKSDNKRTEVIIWERDSN